MIDAGHVQVGRGVRHPAERRVAAVVADPSRESRGEVIASAQARGAEDVSNAGLSDLEQQVVAQQGDLCRGQQAGGKNGH